MNSLIALLCILGSLNLINRELLSEVKISDIYLCNIVFSMNRVEGQRVKEIFLELLTEILIISI